MFANVDSKYTEEVRKIHRVECVRVRFKPPRHSPSDIDIGESWISQSLGIVMLDIDPSKDWKWEISRIEFRQPDPGTFQRPPNFQEEKQ